MSTAMSTGMGTGMSTGMSTGMGTGMSKGIHCLNFNALIELIVTTLKYMPNKQFK